MAQEMLAHYEKVPCLGLEPTRRTPSERRPAFGAKISPGYSTGFVAHFLCLSSNRKPRLIVV